MRVRVVYGASPFHFGRRKADVPWTSCDLLRWCAATHRRFKSFRKRFELKQSIFVFATPQAIYKWQQGAALPTIDNLVVLATVLQVRLDDILVINAAAQMQIGA